MSPETERAWRDEIARLRAEAKAFAARAAQRRKDAIELRKRRDWLGALLADTRAREYRDSRDQRRADVRRIAQLYGIR